MTDVMTETFNRIESTTRWICAAVLVEMDGTVAYDGSPLPTTGYFVGGRYPSLILEDAGNLNDREVRSFVTNSPAVDYYGVWTDKESHVVYIDGVDHYGSISDALAYASERGEIAIWDVANAQEIRLEGLKEI